MVSANGEPSTVIASGSSLATILPPRVLSFVPTSSYVLSPSRWGPYRGPIPPRFSRCEFAQRRLPSRQLQTGRSQSCPFPHIPQLNLLSGCSTSHWLGLSLPVFQRSRGRLILSSELLTLPRSFMYSSVSLKQLAGHSRRSKMCSPRATSSPPGRLNVMWGRRPYRRLKGRPTTPRLIMDLEKGRRGRKHPESFQHHISAESLPHLGDLHFSRGYKSSTDRYECVSVSLRANYNLPPTTSAFVF